MVRVQSQRWAAFVFFSTSCLWAGSLLLQTILEAWQRFYLACTKGYVVNSCLASAALISYEQHAQTSHESNIPSWAIGGKQIFFRQPSFATAALTSIEIFM